MKLNIKMDKCSYNITDLKQFKDADGFIDLTKIVRLSKSSKEPRGNQKRLKNWVQFQDNSALLKEEFYLEQKNFGIYAQLIVEQMAQYFNLPTACYDLMKVKNLNNQLVKGVLSINMLKDNEQLISLYELIGTDDNQEFLDATDYYYVIKTLQTAFAKRGYNENKITNLIRDFQKQLAFSLLVLDTDNHIGNFSFIENFTTKTIKISPIYDKEASLLLDNDQDLIKQLLDDYYLLNETANIAQPRIGCYKDILDGGLSSYWQDTLEALIIDDEIYNFCYEVLGQKLDMDEVFAKVEEKIKAKIPEDVKMLAKYAYLSRYQKFRQIILGTI